MAVHFLLLRNSYTPMVIFPNNYFWLGKNHQQFVLDPEVLLSRKSFFQCFLDLWFRQVITQRVSLWLQSYQLTTKLCMDDLSIQLRLQNRRKLDRNQNLWVRFSVVFLFVSWQKVMKSAIVQFSIENQRSFYCAFRRL